MKRVMQWIRGRMHPSWCLLWLSLGFIIGMAAVPYGVPLSSVALLVLAAPLIVVTFWKRRRLLFAAALTAGVLIGTARGAQYDESLSTMKVYYGQQTTVTGRIIEDVGIGKRGEQTIRLGDIVIAGSPRAGVIWVTTTDKRQLLRGDSVVVSGKLTAGFGTIQATMYRAEIKDRTYVPGSDIGREARDAFATGVRPYLDAENGEFALAYLVGQKMTTSAELNEELRLVGLVHAIVASGAHLTILVAAVHRLLVNRSKYLTAVGSLAMIAGFLLVTGFSPSMTRAALVSGLSLLAWYYGRKIHPLVLIGVVAGMTALYNPGYVWGDIGWYLSFSAFGGVLLLAPVLHHYFWGDTRPGWLREIIVMTIAAQITTLPILLLTFGHVSPYALLSNILVVPLIPFVMLAVFALGVVGLTISWAAPLIALPLSIVLDYMKIIVSWIAGKPGSQVEIAISPVGAAAMYAAIIGMTAYLYRASRHNYRSGVLAQKVL